MCRFGQLEAAAFVKLDIAARQFDFQLVRMVSGTKQHCDFTERNAVLVPLFDRVSDKASLCSFIGRSNDLRARSSLLTGEQGFGEFFLGIGDDGVGQLKNGLGRAVVFFQFDRSRPRILFRKAHDIVEIRAAKTVDRLGIIAHHHDVVVAASEQADNVGLQLVGVLIFVDQQVQEAE